MEEEAVEEQPVLPHSVEQERQPEEEAVEEPPVPRHPAEGGVLIQDESLIVGQQRIRRGVEAAVADWVQPLSSLEAAAEDTGSWQDQEISSGPLKF